MEPVTCPGCNYVNNTEAPDCTQCGGSLVEARLRQSIDAIKQINERMASLKKVPSFSSFNGFGTTLLDYRATGDGNKYEATRWIIALFLPLVPLATYVIEPVGQERSYGRETSSFRVLGQTQLSAARVLRTYLLAAVGLLPIILGFVYQREVNRTLSGGYAFLAMIFCFAWVIYIIFFRLKNEGKAYKTAATK